MSPLHKLAHYIGQSTFRKHLFFIIATLLTLSFAGYYFGTFDQASHLPFFKKYIDSTLYPGDRFIDLRFIHYSYFWFLFEPFYRLGLLEVSMFVVHVVIIYMTIWAIWRLSFTLFKNELVSLLSVVVFILPHISFGGFTVFEFSLVNRTFVLPFLLWALDLYLRRKYYLAFFILGIMFNFHILSVNFVLFMMVFDYILQLKRKDGWKNITLSMILFIVGALPVLIWKLQSHTSDFGLHPDWFSLLSRGFLNHLFYPFSFHPYILFMAVGGISTIFIFFIARRFAPSPKYNQEITNFVYAILVILLIETVTALWFPLDVIIESQIIRVSIFLTLFSYFYLTSYVIKKVQLNKLTKLDTLLLVIALFFSFSPFIALIVIVQQELASLKSLWIALSTLLVTIVFIAGILIVAYQINIWRPGIHVFAEHSTWYEAQLWARDNTPKSTLFITPPYLWWFYSLDWRVVSERSTVSTLAELLEAAFSPQYIDYWRLRFGAVAPGAIDQFRGDTFANFKITKKAFSQLTLKNLKSISNRFNASYLVVERPQQYPLRVAYENRDFIIYNLKSL